MAKYYGWITGMSGGAATWGKMLDFVNVPSIPYVFAPAVPVFALAPNAQAISVMGDSISKMAGNGGGGEGPGNPSSKITGTSYDINQLNKTQPYVDEAKVSAIMTEITEYGPDVVPPIPVRVHDGQVLIIDGHHRFEAFKQLGYDRVPIKYIHGNQLGKIQSDGFTYYRSLQELLDGLVY